MKRRIFRLKKEIDFQCVSLILKKLMPKVNMYKLFISVNEEKKECSFRGKSLPLKLYLCIVKKINNFSKGNGRCAEKIILKIK